MPRLLLVVTHPMTARYLLRGQLRFLRENGFRVAVACSPGADLEQVARREQVDAFPVPISREIRPLSDLRAIGRLRRVIAAWRPDVVNASTPKAGLLGMIAARAARVPVRLYTLRGLRLETTRGLKRWVLRRAERFAAACAGEVVAVSPSLARRVVALKLAPARKVRVLGPGASNGVEVERFAAPDRDAVSALRARLGLGEDRPVIGFVGRFTRDKGLVDLVAAFDGVRGRVPDARLLLVGDFEAGDPVPREARERIEKDGAIVRTGFVPDTSVCYPLMDVLAFPSYREGFPNAPLEAAAAGLPVVGYAATGTVDAVEDGSTGVLVSPGDVPALAEALMRLLADPAERRRLGAAGRERVARLFANEVVWRRWADLYLELLQARGHSSDGSEA